MSRGRQAFNSLLRLILILGLVLGVPLPLAWATGYYNFGMHWKGSFNPQQLGGEYKVPTGFTSITGSDVPSRYFGPEGLASPQGVATSPSGDILVAQTSNNRIARYTSAGVFVGWIGLIRKSPTGGAAGCAGASVGSFTPGWCLGGAADSGSTAGVLAGPNKIAFDSSGNFYVTDGFSALVKFNSSGVLQGWRGKIDISPTGGAAGCAGAAVGTTTPGWCLGGAARWGSSDGTFYFPGGIAIDASDNIYIADGNNQRIVKLNSSGVFQGWIGKIGTSPTGGAVGCNGAAVGSITPGWCTGGAATSSNTGNGALSVPTGLTIDSSGNLYVSNSFSDQITKFNSSGAFLGWMGGIGTSPTGGSAGCNGAAVGTITPGWCIGGSSSSVGAGDGMLSYPQGLHLDSANNLYVVDGGNHARIFKYNSAGVFQGWIGGIKTSPTGGAAGCNGAAVGTFTPGWCTGGTSAQGFQDGMLSAPLDVTVTDAGEILVTDNSNDRVNKYSSSGASLGAIQTLGVFKNSWRRAGLAGADTWGDGMLSSPTSMAFDSSGNFYVADANNYRLSKYSSSGSFLGWIGRIGFSPTGGAAGCAGAAEETVTPGWCLGGSTGYGSSSTDGSLLYPSAVAVDTSGNIYVVANGDNLINKYNSSGVFIGWIGKITTSPTAGAAGCAGAAIGTFTPGWCKGGEGNWGDGDGMLNYPNSIIIDSSGNLLVGDTYNNRISKYSAATGAFLGWIGKIGTSPTGGAAGCNGAAVGTVTPGWCTGGTASSGTGDGMMNDPQGVGIDSSGNIYVTDTDNHRVSKYSSAGVFQGWIGKIGTSPTGGAAGCNGAAVGTVTPGWCTGGTASSGTSDGMFDGPMGIAVDTNGSLYVADNYNSRVLKYNSNGVFKGWFGRIATSPTDGDTGCNGAPVGTVTPGWCKGGTPDWGEGDGMLDSPTGLVLDGKGYLHITDTYNNRIMRIWILGR